MMACDFIPPFQDVDTIFFPEISPLEFYFPFVSRNILRYNLRNFTIPNG